MNDENEDIQMHDSPAPVVRVEPSGVPTSVVCLLAPLLAIAASFAGYGAGRNTQPEPAACQLNNATVAAQAQAQKAQIDYTASCQRNEVQLRMKVIETCVNRGNVPVLIGGNIDCKPGPR